MDNYYNDQYIPSINKHGKILGWIAILVIFLPVLIVTFYFGVIPDKDPFIVAVTAQLSINAIWWIIEPISFYPILGIPGTYLSFLSGNISNLRIPCAAAAQKAAGVKAGSDESTIIATIGVCASIFVNVIFLVIAVVLGSKVISSLPDSVVSSLNFLLPALFGAVFAQFAIDDKKTGLIAMILAIIALTLYNFGLFNWIPIDPFIGVIVVPIFGTIFVARWLHTRKELEQE